MGLVSWNNALNMGKIPGSEWMCPNLNDTDKLKALDRRGPGVTDKDIAELAGGHPQHLEQLRYPEGYLALRVIDGRTGKPTVKHEDGYRYNYDGYSSAVSAQVGKYRLVAINFDSEGTTTNIQPARPLTAREEPPTVLICPQLRSFEISARLGVEALNGGFCDVKIAEDRPTGTHGSLFIGFTKGPHKQDEISVDFAADGNTYTTIPDGDYSWLGREAKAALDSANGDLHRHPDKEQQVLEGVAKILGLGRWKGGINLGKTAGRLYSDLGNADLQASRILISR